MSKQTKKIRILVLFLFTVLTGLPLSYADISFSVSPPIMELNVPSGGVKTMKLLVYNQGDMPIHVNGDIVDMDIEPDGNTTLLPAGSSPWSCADWITLDKDEFDIEAGEKKTVVARLTVPRGTRGGRYAAIIFQAIGPRKRGRGAIVVGARLGTLIMETIPRTIKRQGEIIEIKAKRDPEERFLLGAKAPITFVVSFRNTGNIHIKAKGSVVIKDSNNRIVDRVPLMAGTGTVLPDGVREFEGTWSNKRKMVEGGEYTAEVRITFPGGRARASTNLLT